MTDQEAIDVAKKVKAKYGLPIVHIPPPIGAIDEVITVDLRNSDSPTVTRQPSAEFDPDRS